MLNRLWDHVSNCYGRAADARRRADQTFDPERKAEFLLMEASWTQLAQSYQLSEQLERFLRAHEQDDGKPLDWQRAAVAPFDRDLELAVIGARGIRPLAFPCRRILTGWIAAKSREPLDVSPTHWREWISETAASSKARPARAALRCVQG